MAVRSTCANRLSKSCQRLGLEQIQLWQLHSIDPKVPRLEHAAVKSLQDDGIIRHAGLSNVSVADLEAALEHSEDVLDYCEKHGIGFIPWAPVATGRLSKSGSIDDTAKAHGATPSQIALAWLLKRSPVMVPHSGHLEGRALGRKCRRRRNSVIG